MKLPLRSSGGHGATVANLAHQLIVGCWNRISSAEVGTVHLAPRPTDCDTGALPPGPRMLPPDGEVVFQ